jgi:hypothetical protein
MVLGLAGLGCGSAETGEASAPLCAEGLEAFRGRCVEPGTRYEPDAPLDQDNVLAYGDPLTRLAPPPPPRSGFRLVAPPVTLEPGEELSTCVSWPLPELHHDIVYSARMFSTAGLHHSNVLAKPVDAELGPQPYPGCRPDASEAFSSFGDGIPDVLFANSTQLVGEEDLVFPAGMGYRLDASREVTTDIHYLNVAGERQVIEVVYDLFTMPEADLETEVAPFVMTIFDFLVPPRSRAVVETSCDVFGGQVVAMMPHTHQFATRFSVDLIGLDGSTTTVMDQGPYDAESDIESYAPALDLSGTDRMRFACDFDNPTDRDVVYGLGDQEMCILFGFVYPPRSQFVGYVANAGDPCTSVQIGIFR